MRRAWERVRMRVRAWKGRLHACVHTGKTLDTLASTGPWLDSLAHRCPLSPASAPICTLLSSLPIPAPGGARRHGSVEAQQLVLVAWCLVGAWTGGQLGLSEELGAFIAGAAPCARGWWRTLKGQPCV
jgi:hypothetical protein